jgi:hypothetical protein
MVRFVVGLPVCSKLDAGLVPGAPASRLSLPDRTTS